MFSHFSTCELCHKEDLTNVEGRGNNSLYFRDPKHPNCLGGSDIKTLSNLFIFWHCDTIDCATLLS